MVTSFPQDVVVGRQAGARQPADEGWWARVGTRIQQAWCGLHRHDSLLEFERDRMFLRCTSCGYETPGWMVKAARPTLRFRSQARAHAAAGKPRLVGARRTA